MYMRWLRNFWTTQDASANEFGLPAPEVPLYVIGDIHGCADQLAKILGYIDRHITENKIKSPKMVFVGDYIDRGEQVAEVLRQIRETWCSMPEDVICLLGNHEKMMLDFLDRPGKFGRLWLHNGGLQTLASFGLVGTFGDGASDQLLEGVAYQLREKLTAETENWLRALPLIWQSGNTVVVHAAADPSLPIAEQSEQVLLWGMPEFFRMPRQDGLWVVHGHTVVEEGHAKKGRIAIDTGAVFGGDLTAAAIGTDGKLEFLKV